MIECRKTYVHVLLLLFASITTVQAQTNPSNNTAWPFDVIALSKATSFPEKQAPIIVAVIDDAFRTSHKTLKDFIYEHPTEIPNNQYDDDGNGYIDDVSGWDISDNDKDVSVPEGREKVFFHGTYIASIITQSAQAHYGEQASQYIKIMPIKVLPDQATNTYLKDGYKGIRYAIDNGADIICLAWCGGDLTKENIDLLQEAHQKGILVIGSVGNFNQEKVLPPASFPQVLAVSGINELLQKEKQANYGKEVDIAAPASQIKGAHPQKDNAFIKDSGTSPATALLAGCAAILLSKNKQNSPTQIKEALQNTSQTFPSNYSEYGGKMGAGMVQLTPAIDYLSAPNQRSKYYSPLRPKGSIYYDKNSSSQEWEIKPEGTYHGFTIRPYISSIKKAHKYQLQISVADTLWNEYPLSKLPPQLYVPASSISIQLINRPFKKKEYLRLYYEGTPIDSSKLYCSETKHLSAEKGIINDGSGNQAYANDCSCKWLISLPEGKRIQFTFDQLDTQANTDWIYLADGNTMLPENILGQFSGQQIPPVIYSSSNEVLIWFVTDASITGQGWELRYETIDD